MAGGLHIEKEGDGALQDWANATKALSDPVHLTAETSEMRLLYLSGGMESGKPAVMLAARRPGETAFYCLELSAALLVTGAAAIKEWARQEGFDL